MHVTCRAVQHHYKFVYRDTLVLVSQYPFVLILHMIWTMLRFKYDTLMCSTINKRIVLM